MGPTKNRNHHDVYFCRYETRVDYIYCNENVLKEWLPFVVKHFDENVLKEREPVAVEHFKRDISDHKAVIATLIKKSGK